MSGTCTGPNGEPGYQITGPSWSTPCFTYTPGDRFSELAAMRAAARAADELAAQGTQDGPVA